MNRYSVSNKRVIEGKRVTGTSIYPEVASSQQDYYIITSMGDRYDILSQQFYGSSEYWWVIASNNPHSRRDTLFLEPGIQLRIPPFRVVKKQYEDLNESR